VFFKESFESLTEGEDRVTTAKVIKLMISKRCWGDSDSGEFVLQEAPRADAPRARNASADAAAAACLFAQPGVSPLPQPVWPKRRARGAA
jgi:hypothetical protein